MAKVRRDPDQEPERSLRQQPEARPETRQRSHQTGTEGQSDALHKHIHSFRWKSKLHVKTECFMARWESVDGREAGNPPFLWLSSECWTRSRVTGAS